MTITCSVERLERCILLTGKRLVPEVQTQLKQLLTPQALTIVACGIGAWIVGHAFGFG